MNRNVSLIIVAVMALAVIGNVALQGPNWVALIFVIIAGAAWAFRRDDEAATDVD